MPCWETRKISLDFDKAQPSVMTKALESLGYKVTDVGNGALRFQRPGRSAGTFNGGKIVVGESEAETLKDLKRVYSRESVKMAARKFGWTVQADPQNEWKVNISRQGF